MAERTIWVDEASGVVANGDRVPGVDGLGRGGEENSPSTQAATNARPEQDASYNYSQPGSETPPGVHVIESEEEGIDGSKPET